MSELVFPTDGPVITGMSSYYLSFQRLVTHYQQEMGAGCVHLRGGAAEGLLYFDKKRMVDCVYTDSAGRTTGRSAMRVLQEEIGKQNFKVSVFTVREASLLYWASLIHVRLQGERQKITKEDLVRLLERYNNGSVPGYLRIQGEKRRQTGWVMLHSAGIHGFRLPGEMAPWLEPEELVDFLGRFSGTGALLVEGWSVAGNGENAAGQVQHPAGEATLAALTELLRRVEGEILPGRKDLPPFATLFRKVCVDLADLYDFLDPFAGEMEFSGHGLLFHGNAGDREVMEGVLKAVEKIGQEYGMLEGITALMGTWRERHATRLAKYQVRF